MVSCAQVHTEVKVPQPSSCLITASCSWQLLQLLRGSTGKQGSQRPGPCFLLSHPPISASYFTRPSRPVHVPPSPGGLPSFSLLSPSSKTSGISSSVRTCLGKQPSLTCPAQLSSLGSEDAMHIFVSSPKFQKVMIEILFDYSSLMYIQYKILGNCRKAQNHHQ